MTQIQDKQINFTTLLNSEFQADALSTANVAALTGLATTIDGVALSISGMKVLLTAQATGAQNGPWLVRAGAWVRPSNYAAGASFSGTSFAIKRGTVHAGEGWIANAATPDVIDTDASTWSAFSLAASQARALAQATWYVSFLTGDNGATGLVGAPVKTVAEIIRRWGSKSPNLTTATVTINIIDHDTSDNIDLVFLNQISCTITIQPVTTTVLQSGTLTATRPAVQSTNTPPGITDTAISGGVWPIGKRIKYTSGPALNAYAWTLKDEGGQVARVTNAADASSTVLQPVAGNTYNIETLTDLWVSTLSLNGVKTTGQNLLVNNFNLRSSTGANLVGLQNNTRLCTFNRCSFANSLNLQKCVNVNLDNCYLAATTTAAVAFNSSITFTNGGGVGTGSQGILVTFNSIVISNGYIGQNKPILCSGDAKATGSSYACFDALVTVRNPNGSGLVIGMGDVDPKLPATWSTVLDGRVWGSGNAGYGISLGPNCLFAYLAAADAPTITGTTGDWQSAAAGSVQKGVGYNGATFIVEGPFSNTYALLGTASPTGFGGCAFDSRTGARLINVNRVFT